MKSIILCCNYNEGKTGNLERCLNALKRNKLNDTFIALIDNASKDNSLEIINKFVKDKTIDVFIANSKNLGKPKALNLLFKYSLLSGLFSYNDLCIHLDSDIKIYDNFIQSAQDCFSKFNDCYIFFSKGSSLENEYLNDKGHFIKDNEYINVDENFQKIFKGPGIQGCCWAMKIHSFLEVNLYRENRGKDGKSAIYGGDDGFLIYDLFVKNQDKFAYVHKNKYHYHPPVLDEEYKKWKNTQNLLTGKINQTSKDNELLAEKGFYD
jgi:glycosyltransferase involved in cell wall biosynthesis